jgi:4-azaleucine resistance transporter AzlC
MSTVPAVRFTRAGGLAGARAVLPILPGTVAFGLVYGFLAGEKGLSVLQVVLTSALVFAGAAQLVALELWRDPVPLLAVASAVLIVNLRHVMMGPALLPWLHGLPPARAYGSLFFMADESWAVSVTELRRGGRDAAFLLGAGLCLWLVWIAAGLAGRLALATAVDASGLHYLTVAFFVALLAGFWRGRGDVAPWLLAGGMAILADTTLPGTWHIVLGALVGSLVGAALERHGQG